MKAALLLLLSAAATIGQPSSSLPIRYELLFGSYFVDECLICGRPTILEPLRGSFWLTATSDPQHWRVSEVLLTNENSRVTGSGQVDLKQERYDVRLNLTVERKNADPENLLFISDPEGEQRTFPMLGAVLRETPGTLVRTFSIGLAAAPLREILFSTKHGFTSAEPSLGSGTSGDVLGHSGRFLIKQPELLKHLLPQDPSASPGIDALDFLSAEGAVFSLETDLPTEFGTLGHVKVVSQGATTVLTWDHLLETFQISPEAASSASLGFDAIHRVAPDEHWFSFSGTPVYSGTLQSEISPGDVLSTKGRRIKRGSDLSVMLSLEKGDYGCDALFVWPNGEIWFSPETGFESFWGPISEGDLLSDKGYIVIQNLELLQPFMPMEDLANFGLDALHVLTDLSNSVAASPVRIYKAFTDGDQFVLEWTVAGQFHQVEKSATPDGGYVPASPILSDYRWSERIENDGPRFYRVRQWPALFLQAAE